MSEYFPTVGVAGSEALVRMMLAPALALGVDIVKIETDVGAAELEKYTMTSVIGDSIPISKMRALENSGVIVRPDSSSMSFAENWNSDRKPEESLDARFSVLVARSPHGQASAWTPTEINNEESARMTVTPSPRLLPHQVGIAQMMALDLVMESGAVGVMDVEISLKNGEVHACHLSLGPTMNGLWTIEGARTSQFEQHLRAILDLPLGDPSLVAPFAVSGTYFGEQNMYSPYLHLMARSPGLKIHQYRSGPSLAKGHVTALGEDLLDLKECVTHAVEYMSGVIDE